MEGKPSNLETIKKIDSDGGEYWNARDVAPLLGYTKWQNFEIAIQRAMVICELTGIEVSKHFIETKKSIFLGSRATRDIRDYCLTRYAVHLILTCSDMKKSEVIQSLAYLALISLNEETDYYTKVQTLKLAIPDNIDVTKEQKTIKKIQKAFIHLETVRQYRVTPYYIDLYFPSHRVAVECDEHGHSRYSLDAESKRQEYINQVLNCVFVRYNPDDRNFSIEDVINNIMVLIYKL